MAFDRTGWRVLLALTPLLALAGCSALPKLGGVGGDEAATASTTAPATTTTAAPATATATGGLGLASLSAIAPAPAHVIVAEAPADVYTRLARQIYACWLSSEPPLLPGQLFYAEAEPGETGNARISLHTPGEDNHKGLRTYAIAMLRVPEGTRIETEALRITDATQREAMHGAVMAWARGETACDAGRAPTAVAAVPAPVPAGTAAAKPTNAKAIAAAAAAGKRSSRPQGPRVPAATPAAKPTAGPTPPASPSPAAAAARPAEPPTPTPTQTQPAPAAQPQPVADRPQPPSAPPPAPRSLSLRGALDAEPPTTASVPAPQPPQPLAAPGAAPAPETPAATATWPADHKFLQTEPAFARR